jgi:hypothetical protein
MNDFQDSKGNYVVEWCIANKVYFAVPCELGKYKSRDMAIYVAAELNDLTYDEQELLNEGL